MLQSVCDDKQMCMCQVKGHVVMLQLAWEQNQNATIKAQLHTVLL